MISIREGAFETNSSSMHALTFCAPVSDPEYVKKELERWKQKDGSYKIDIVLDDDNVDEGSFTIRHYIRHSSINDKLMYLFATIMQHYDNLLFSGPQEPTHPYHFLKDAEEDLKKRHDAWREEYRTWEKLGYRPANKAILKKFEEHIKDLEEGLSSYFRDILFGDGPDYGWDSSMEHYGPLTPDTRPEVTVKFNYKILNNDCIYPTNEDEWFSTGCYGNEEFYASMYDCRVWWVKDWIGNPYDQILAGGDEQDDEDYVAQRKDAKELLDKAYEEAKKACKDDPDEDYHFIMNEGKVIWPIGG